MKYRSGIEFDARDPKASERRLATTAGHTAIVTHEWRELPATLHAAAVKAGCEVDKESVIANEHETKPSLKAVNQDTEIGHIVKAIKSLLADNVDGDFTADGIPKVQSVSKACGFTASKSQVMEAFAIVQEEAAANVAGAE